MVLNHFLKEYLYCQLCKSSPRDFRFEKLQNETAVST